MMKRFKVIHYTEKPQRPPNKYSNYRTKTKNRRFNCKPNMLRVDGEKLFKTYETAEAYALYKGYSMFNVQCVFVGDTK